MVKIAVFDSGLGSLSIIMAIQKISKAELIYFADQKNFPYGNKTKKELQRIIDHSILGLQKRFHPDLIIVGSNTPSLMLSKVFSKNIVGVLPPLKQASASTKTKSIAILATQSAVKSKELSKFIKKQIPKKIKVIKINSSSLVELVETGKFLHDKDYCIKKIRKTLDKKFLDNDIDVATLSSTHLPFLIDIFKKLYPNVIFLDPAENVAKKVLKISKLKEQKKRKLHVFTSKRSKCFEKNLHELGIRNKVKILTMP